MMARPHHHRSASGSGSSALARGLQVLDVAATYGPARVERIAYYANLARSTAYRYVSQLRDAGYLVEDNGRYAVGPRMAVAAGSRTSRHLVGMAEGVLDGLRTATGMTALLSVRVGDTALCLDCASSPDLDPPPVRRGQTGSLHAGAGAIALLAFAPAEVASAVLATKAAARADLEREIDSCRQRHLVVSYHLEEIGVPVFRGATCVCGISVAGSLSGLTDTALDSVVEAVRQAGSVLRDRLNVDDGAHAWAEDAGLRRIG